jgi:hypothetical protein
MVLIQVAAWTIRRGEMFLWHKATQKPRTQANIGQKLFATPVSRTIDLNTYNCLDC